MMQQMDDFGAFLQRTLHQDMCVNDHLSDEVLLDGLTDSLSPEVLAQLTDHFRSCPVCRSRSEALSQDATTQTRKILESSVLPCFCDAVRTRNRTGRVWRSSRRTEQSTGASWRALCLQFLPALASTAVVLVITLGFVVPGITTYLSRIDEISATVLSLQDDVEHVRQIASTIPPSVSDMSTSVKELEQHVADLPNALWGYTSRVTSGHSAVSTGQTSLTPSQIAAIAGAFTHPVQRAMFVITSLQAQGFLDPASLDWENPFVHRAHEGEAWSDVSIAAFGVPHLWPLIWALNSEVADLDAALKGGAHIWFPSLTGPQQ